MNNQKSVQAVKSRLWEQPWRYKESFLIAFELMLAGFALEAITGGRGFSPIQYPSNLIIGIVFILAIVVIYFLYRKKHLVRWFSSVPAALSSITFLGLFVLLLGFIPQDMANAPKLVKFTGLDHVKHSWPFLLSQPYFMATLGMVTLKRAIPLKLIIMFSV